MKKIAIYLMLTCLSLTFIPIHLNASTPSESATVPAPKPAEPADTKTLELRLNEINAMDKSKMKSAEKKNLRKEVKSIKRNLRELGGGVYLSAGAIILVLILIIILL